MYCKPNYKTTSEVKSPPVLPILTTHDYKDLIINLISSCSGSNTLLFEADIENVISKYDTFFL